MKSISRLIKTHCDIIRNGCYLFEWLFERSETDKQREKEKERVCSSCVYKCKDTFHPSSARGAYFQNSARESESSKSEKKGRIPCVCDCVRICVYTKELWRRRFLSTVEEDERQREKGRERGSWESVFNRIRLDWS